MPVHRQPFESFSRWKLPQTIGPLRRLPQPEIVHRQHIRSSQLEDQEHLRSPPSNPSDSVELPHRLLIRQPLQPFQIQPPIHEPLSQIPNVRDLLRRQPNLPKPIHIRRQILSRTRQPPTIQPLEPVQNRPRGRPGQLLKDDRANNRLVVIIVQLEPQRTGTADNPSQHTVPPLQISNPDSPDLWIGERPSRRTPKQQRSHTLPSSNQPS